jgi:hypothetical protein
MDLADLFLAIMYDPKTRLSSQGEYTHIRPSPKSTLVDVGYHNPSPLRTSRALISNYNTAPH